MIELGAEACGLGIVCLKSYSGALAVGGYLQWCNHSALALFAQRTRIPTSARSTGFCAIWVCISSSSSSLFM